MLLALTHGGTLVSVYRCTQKTVHAYVREAVLVGVLPSKPTNETESKTAAGVVGSKSSGSVTEGESLAARTETAQVWL